MPTESVSRHGVWNEPHLVVWSKAQNRGGKSINPAMIRYDYDPAGSRFGEKHPSQLIFG